MAGEKVKGLNESELGEENYAAGRSQPGENFFEIRVKGQLDSCWSDWLGGLGVRLLENGEMILFGPIEDQAALMGILNRCNRLNLAIRSINERNPQMKENE